MSGYEYLSKVSFSRHMKDVTIANFISNNFDVGESLPGNNIMSARLGYSNQTYRDFVLTMAAKGFFKLSQGVPVVVIKDPLDCEEHW